MLLLIAVPMLFRGRIEGRLKSQINQTVNAQVDWSGIGLAVLRDFPNVTLSVERPTVVGVSRFVGDTLVTMRGVRLVLDIGSVFRYLTSGATIVVREISFDQPDARLRVLPDGAANWDITKPGSGQSSGPSRAVGITLRELRISDGRVALDDQQSHLQASIVGLQESLSGDFGRQRFVLTTRTRLDTASLRFGGIPYLNRVTVELNASVDADQAAHRFTLTHDTLRLNALRLAFAGSITSGTPDLGLDLTFAAPGTSFRDILSLMPAIYAHDFERVQTTGTMSVSGRVRGSYGPKAFPSFSVVTRVADAAFQYPSLPLPARGINLDLSITNPGGHVDSTVVKIDRLRAVIGNRPMEARLVVRTPVSDPDVDLRVIGSLDLADVAKTVKLEGVNDLAGFVSADVAMRARLSDVDAKRYDRVDARGTSSIARLAVRAPDIPQPFAIDTASVRFTPRAAELTSFSARIGKSDVRATGSLDNLLGFALHGEDLRGTASVASRQFDLDEWKSEEPTTQVIPVPGGIDFTLKASADQVLFTPIAMSGVAGEVRIKDRRATLSGLRAAMLKGAIVANGFYDTKDLAHPAFDFTLRLDTLDIPSAFSSVNTVQALVPAARWARGLVSGTMALAGPLDSTMTPVMSVVTGSGALDLDRLAIEGMPVLDKLADALSIEQLRNPTLRPLRVAFDVANGRVNVKPFSAALAGMEMTVGGSHGIDQTLRYDMSLAVPRAMLGGTANAAIAKLAARAGKTGADVTGGDAVRLNAKVVGTVAKPEVSVDFAGTAATVRAAAETAIRQQIESRTEAVKQKADSALDANRARARAEAEKIIAEATRQADTIRAQARVVAERIRQEAATRADSLVVRATNPIAKRAAEAAADRAKREADQQADRVVREADARADAIVAEAKRRGEAIGGGPPPPVQLMLTR
jgi:hypothetical protein